MPLTDPSVRILRPSEKPYKKADFGGLYLLVKPSGSKLWRFDYRFFAARKTLALGQYPAVSLAEARAARDLAKQALARDQDPAIQKRNQKLEAAQAASNTFGLIAEEFIEKLRADGRANPTIVKNTWMLVDLCKSISKRPIGTLGAADILEVLRKIERRGHVETALATRSAIGWVFRYAIATARASNDPTYALRGALRRHVVTNHAAIIKESDVGGLMKAVWGYEGWPTLAAALKIQALCFARPGETRTMEWREVDLQRAIWTIPATKAKMRRDHRIPLSRQAVAVIQGMELWREDSNAFVFPSMMSGKPYLSENAMNSALRRMGFTKDQHAAHGFRSTASTLLNESKLFHGDWIEAQLAHQDGNAVRRIYNRSEYWEERVQMMQWWADFIDRKLAGRGRIPNVGDWV